METNIKFIFRELGFSKNEVFVDSDNETVFTALLGLDKLDTPDLKPEDFLEQSEYDFETGGKTALLNSITNAKRAIYCQIDEIIDFWGFDSKKIKIGKKIDMLNEMGFLAPRILRKVSDSRNLLEHEYKRPIIKDVEDALDLASLFIAACSNFLVSSCFIFSNSVQSLK